MGKKPDQFGLGESRWGGGSEKQKYEQRLCTLLIVYMLRNFV